MISFDRMLEVLIKDPHHFSNKMSTEPALFKEKAIFPDFPKTGPLAKYRADATFDWRRLKVAVEDEEALLLRNKIWSFCKQHPMFQKKIDETLSMDDQRHLATKRMLVGYKQRFYDIDDVS